MKPEREISSFVVSLRSGPGITSDELESLLERDEFQVFADLIPDGIIVVDPSEAVVFLNKSAEAITGRSRPRLPQSLEHFLRTSDLELDEFIAAAGQSNFLGRVRVKSSSRILLANRRILPVTDRHGGFQVIYLRPQEGWEPPPNEGGKSARRHIPNSVERLLLTPALSKELDRALKAYLRNMRVILLGESGVGKTVIARQIHDQVRTPRRPFIHVNCASIPESLFESEMFGYERGSFTGALQAGKRGFIECAAGGTLFLDEIGEMPLPSQAKLLKFLEDGTIQPVGSSASKHVDARVISATNRDLSDMVGQGLFRRDLYFRLATFPVRIPPLRDRPDINAIIDSLVERASAERGSRLELTAECRDALLAYDYPGNLRELKSAIEFLDIVCDAKARFSDLPAVIQAGRRSVAAPVEEADLFTEGRSLKDLRQAFEDRIIASAVQRYGSKREAARHLGVDIATVVRKTSRGRE